MTHEKITLTQLESFLFKVSVKVLRDADQSHRVKAHESVGWYFEYERFQDATAQARSRTLSKSGIPTPVDTVALEIGRLCETELEAGGKMSRREVAAMAKRERRLRYACERGLRTGEFMSDAERGDTELSQRITAVV